MAQNQNECKINTISTGLLVQLFLFHRFFFSSSQKRSGLANTFFRLSLSWTQKYSTNQVHIYLMHLFGFSETDKFCSKVQNHKVQ